MSRADRCRVPLPINSARSSSSDSDNAPRATRRSRGRVDSGHSRMGTHARYRTRLHYAVVTQDRFQSTTAATSAALTITMAAIVIACDPDPAQATNGLSELPKPESPSVSQTGRPRNGKPDTANRIENPRTLRGRTRDCRVAVHNSSHTREAAPTRIGPRARRGSRHRGAIRPPCLRRGRSSRARRSPSRSTGRCSTRAG